MENQPELQPHQQRVVDEKAELDKKLDALCQLKYTDRFYGLAFAEQERLNTQGHLMCAYSAILGARIAAFTE